MLVEVAGLLFLSKKRNARDHCFQVLVRVEGVGKIRRNGWHCVELSVGTAILCSQYELFSALIILFGRLCRYQQGPLIQFHDLVRSILIEYINA